MTVVDTSRPQARQQEAAGGGRQAGPSREGARRPSGQQWASASTRGCPPTEESSASLSITRVCLCGMGGRTKISARESRLPPSLTAQVGDQAPFPPHSSQRWGP